MDSRDRQRLLRLIDKVRHYDKENLGDILHVAVDAVNLVTRQSRCRVYLEDLTRGSLECVAATGAHADVLRGRPFPINSDDFMVSRVYASHEEAQLPRMELAPTAYARQMADEFGIRASLLMPLLAGRRAVGVVCIDSGRPGQLPDETQRKDLYDFFSEVSPRLNQALKYHQQLILARRVDEAKKKEAALTMVRSAVRLIDRLALAAVLVPAPLTPGSEEAGLEVLAAASKDKQTRRVYEDEGLIDLGPGKSLLAQFINRQGVIIDERLLAPLFVPKLDDMTLQKQYLTEELGLKSLYIVPRYDAQTRRVICLVNYYTTEDYEFNAHEKGLLEGHAEMAERVIQEIGSEHMEIQVLSEINDLLQEKFDAPPPFLARVLSKATELIGADTGSIALVEEIDGERWLKVESSEGELIGAKSKEWLKKDIPPIRVGGANLPPEERSLTGLAAHSGKPQIILDTTDPQKHGGFYREITPVIQSEIAVPVISNDEVLAVICLDSLKTQHFTEEHRRILMIIERMIARQLSDLLRIQQLTHEVSRLRSDIGYRDPKISSYKLGNIIGNSAKSREIIDFIEQITLPLANRMALWQQGGTQEATLGLPSILIHGETGSGKEFLFNNLFSRLNEIYRRQIDPQGELTVRKTNIAAYSGELTYSELFGHKRGAFTGAHADRRGILEEAHGGVVFLDEIGDADPKTQVQLLRFLDNGGFIRLGESTTRYARVVLVAATNKNLRELISQGLFREDLYYRLSELTIEVPSLNERREDIPDLAVHFLGRLWQVYKDPAETGGEAPTLTREAQEEMARHLYTGNVRELRSILLRALLFSSGKRIDGAAIRRALGAPLPAQGGSQLEQLASQAADAVYTAIRDQRDDFWSGIYEPYSENRITRDVVIEVINRARGDGATSMPKIARLLRACDPDNPAEQKVFFRFKNFLYKTIRIG